MVVDAVAVPRLSFCMLCPETHHMINLSLKQDNFGMIFAYLGFLKVPEEKVGTVNVWIARAAPAVCVSVAH